jgi:hypothetical protein
MYSIQANPVRRCINIALVRGIMAIVCLAATLCAYPSFGQEFRSVLTGQITDPSGAVIRGATITAVEVSTGTSYTNKTTDRGTYYIPYVVPGTYRVTVEANGFKTSVQDNVLLKASDSFTQNFKLEVGSATEKIEVTTAPPELETSSGSGNTVIDARQLENVPLNGAQVYMLLGTTPGSQFTQTQFGPGGYSGTRGWDVTNSYTLGGGVGGTNQFTLNGTNITQQTAAQNGAGSWIVAPNIDAIQDTNVMTTTYDVRYGRTSGGTVNMSTKNGTNQFHGTADEAYEGALMNANTFTNNIAGEPRGGWVQNQFHITAGGPIKKNRLFFFFGYEGYRESLAGQVLTHVPPAYLRPGYNGNAGVDYSLIQTMDPAEYPNGIPIYQPGTSYCQTPGTTLAQCSGDQVAQVQFPGNAIPGSQINPVSAALLNYVPLPNIPNAANLAGGNNFIAATPDVYDYNQPMIRVDYNITQATKMYSYYEWQKGTENRNTNGLPGIAATGNINHVRENWVATQDFTHVFSPSLLGDFKVSFTRYLESAWDGNLNQAVDPASIGLTMPLPPTTTLKTFPETHVSDIVGNNTIFGNTPSAGVSNNIGFDTDFTKTWGSHNIHVGGMIYEFQYNGFGNVGNGSGNFSFNGGFTQFDPANGSCYQAVPAPNNPCNSNQATGLGSASMLLGDPASGGITWDLTLAEGQPVYAIYAQDDWRVTPRLTLNLGIRWDVERGLRERNNLLDRGLCLTCVSPITNDPNYQANINNGNNQAAWAAAGVPTPGTVYGGLQFAGSNGQPRSAYNLDWTDIGPRVGFAYQLDPKTVLRGGWGLVYSYGLEAGNASGSSANTPYIASLDGYSPTNYFQTGSPFSNVNNVVNAPPADSLGLLTDVGEGIGMEDFPDRKIPREKVFSFGMQHEFPAGVVLDARYAANYTSKLRVGLWTNGTVTLAEQQAAQANPAIWDQQVPNPYYGVASMVANGCGQGQTVQAITLLLALSQYCSPSQQSITGQPNAPLGHNWYNGLEVKLTKRLQGNSAVSGLTFQLAYTWSKTINGDGYRNGWPYQDPHQIHQLAGSDRTHVLGLTTVYDLPFGKGAMLYNNPNRIMGAIINHWRLSSVISAQSGEPVGLNGSYQYNCTHSYRPDNGTSVGQGHWFYANKSCFAGNTQYQLATITDVTDDVRTPRIANVDLSLIKQIPIREWANFTLRLDAFNAFNSVLFGGPDTSPGDANATYTPGAGWSGFGTIGAQQQNFPRILQISGKITF